MNIIKTQIELFEEFRRNYLFRNSILITFSRFSNVFVGFVFWIVAARLYSIEEVGLATVLISSLSIIASLSKMGFDFSLIRYIEIFDKTKLFNTFIAATTIVSLVIGIIYIVDIKIFSPSLIFIQESSYPAIFLFLVMNSIVIIIGSGFNALRKSEGYLFQNMILALRVPLLIPLVYLGSFGIFSSIGLAFLFSALFSLIYLSKTVKLNLKIDKQIIRESFKFSGSNYVSNIFATFPTLILPIMVSNVLGGALAAEYYVAFAIGSLVNIIPESLGTSLFVEGSHGEKMRKNVIKVGLTVYSFLIPAILFIHFFGIYILGLFGENYLDALLLLKLIAYSSFFSSLMPIFVSLMNVKMKMKILVLINFLMFCLLIGLSYLFILRFGIEGVGYAWIISYATLDILIIVFIKKFGWI